MSNSTILGAIAGDIIGSVYERRNHKSKEFPLFDERAKFTDDSVMTLAVADALMHGKDIAETLKAYGRKYPDAGYGGRFSRWISSDEKTPYHSFGNGSAMRVSPVGFMVNSVAECLELARKTAEVSHNHPEGIKGAQAVSLAGFLAKNGATKNEIQEEIGERFGYDLNFTCDEIRPKYGFDVSCQGSVPQALVAFLDGSSYEDTLRNANSIGGDSDTIACISGGIAAAFYDGIPGDIRKYALGKLPPELKDIVLEFEERF